MNERIRKLADEADEYTKQTVHYYQGQFNGLTWEGKIKQTRDTKFAELIVGECTAVLFDESERLSGLYSEEDNWNSAEEYEIRSNQCVNNIELIEKHFGVEE